MGELIKKPMKGDDMVREKLRFPYLASPKIDGYRGFVDGGVIRMSSGVPYPNDFTRDLFSMIVAEGFDGEMGVGSPCDVETFKRASGSFRKKTGEPDVVMYVFDDRTLHDWAFEDRLNRVKARIEGIKAAARSDLPADARVRLQALADRIVFHEHVLIENLEQLDAYESKCVAEGYEGVMLRDPRGKYKHGRSTVNENLLLKVKRMVHDEAEIVGFVERMENTSESFKDELGRSKKSYKAEDLVGTGMIGSFIVRDPKYPRDFNISASSMKRQESAQAFRDFDTEYRGNLARYAYFPVGTDEVPRHGVFDGLRERSDL